MRSKIVITLVGAALLTLPAGATGGGTAGSALATGTITTPTGVPIASGRAYLLQDTTDANAKSGTMPIVATGAVTNGQLQMDAGSGALNGVKADGAGYRNFILSVISAQGNAFQPVAQAVSAQAARVGAPLRLNVTTNLPGSRPRPRQALVPNDCHYGLENVYTKRIAMTEIHDWFHSTATFSYGEGSTADSMVGVAVQDPQGHWVAADEAHVSKTSSAGETAPLRRRGDRLVTGVFEFHTIAINDPNCPVSVQRFTRAARFDEGMRVERRRRSPRGLSGLCQGIAQRAGEPPVQPTITRETTSTRSRTVARALTVFGVSLGASSGWSRYAQTTITNRGSHALYTCGLAGDGSGTTYAKGAMVYAGPFAGSGG